MRLKDKSLSSKLSIIQPILVKYFEEKERIEQPMIKTGKVPEILCKTCPHYEEKEISKLKTDEKEAYLKLYEWIKRNEIIELSYDPSRMIVHITSQTNNLIPEYLVRPSHYHYPWSFFKKLFKTIPPSEIVEKINISGFEGCQHYDSIKDKEVFQLIIKRKYPHGVLRKYETIKRVYTLFLCQQCLSEIQKQRCSYVRKRGFEYSPCILYGEFLFAQILEQHNIKYRTGETEHYEAPHDFYLDDLGVFITFRRDISGAIDALKPNLIVSFRDRKGIFDFLDYNTNVLLASVDGFYFFDKSRQVEETIEKIVGKIVEKVDEYASKIRGNEHDRMVKAFEKIGQELGYVSQREYGKRGLRVDCVWHDRQGNIRVAIEVETRGGWKKDILSTWELEPRLSIITTYQKTDSVPKALMNFALMKSIPHKLLYINMETKNAYLFDKQEILRRYSLKKEEMEERFSLKEV